MAIFSYPYTSMDGDRKYTAAQLAQAAATLATSGIVPTKNSFLCSIVSGSMNIAVEPGQARLAGHAVDSDAQETVTLSVGHASNPRIDLIVVESNESSGVRASRIVVLEGTASATPTAPMPTQEAGLWQEILCSVLVPAGATTLSGATLTDLRSFCLGKHRHAIADIAGLTDALAGKAAASHVHSIANVSGLQTALDGKAATTHTHAISNVSGLQAALDGKSATTHTHDSRYYTEGEVDNKLELKQNALDFAQRRRITVSGNSPSGGEDGELWVKV